MIINNPLFSFAKNKHNKDRGFTIHRLRSGHQTLSLSKGFTIVELLVVIVIIGILAAITAVSYSGISQKAIITSLKSDLTNASTQLEVDKILTNTYPTTKEAANNGQGLQASPGTTFEYTYSSGTDSYILVATKSGISYYITSADKTLIAGVPTSSLITFAVALGNDNYDYADSVIQTSDGGYAVTGTRYSSDTFSDDAFLAKYTDSGVLSWITSWGDGGADRSHSVVQTSDNGIVITGDAEEYGDGPTGTFLIKYDTSGNVVWSHVVYDSSRSYSMDTTSDGGFIVTGQKDMKMYIAKYNSSGNHLWNKTWIDGWYAQGDSVIQTADSGYAVTGVVAYGGATYDMFIAKYDVNGTLLWDKTWGGAAATYASGNSIVQTSDNGYAVVGQDSGHGSGDYDSFIAKYDSAGTLSWDKTWGGPAVDRAHSIIETSDSSLVVAGETESYGSGMNDMFVIKYNSTGTIIWDKTWGEVTADVGNSIISTDDGGYIVSGYTDNYGAGASDILLVKMDNVGLVAGCLSSVCRDPSAAESSPAATETSPIATLSVFADPVFINTYTLYNPELTETIVLAP